MDYNYSKCYYQFHRKEILDYMKKYYQRNKEQIKARVKANQLAKKISIINK